jgi:hypothetical protein
MDKGFKISDLDRTTLEFAKEKAWGFKFMCKTTKKGKIEENCYARMESLFNHFINELDRLEKEEEEK